MCIVSMLLDASGTELGNVWTVHELQSSGSCLQEGGSSELAESAFISWN